VYNYNVNHLNSTAKQYHIQTQRVIKQATNSPNRSFSSSKSITTICHKYSNMWRRFFYYKLSNFKR